MHDAMINSMLRIEVCFSKDYSESIAEDLVTVFIAKHVFKFHSAQSCYYLHSLIIPLRLFQRLCLYIVRKIFMDYLPRRRCLLGQEIIYVQGTEVQKGEKAAVLLLCQSTLMLARSHTLSHCSQSHLLATFFPQHYKANDTSTTKMLFIFLSHLDHGDSTKEGWENTNGENNGSNNFSGNASLT